jgi:hypothetical protein
MPLLAAAVRVGITGELYAAPTGTPRPTDSTTALNSGYIGLGYVSEDGVTETHEDTIEDIVAWQNATVVRSVRTESVMRLACTLIETKGEVLELYHPGSQIEAVGAGQWKLEIPTPTTDRRQFALDVIDGTKHLRIDVPNGEVTERGEIQYANGEPVGYEVTITCYPDENGLLAIKYSDDPNWGYS